MKNFTNKSCYTKRIFLLKNFLGGRGVPLSVSRRILISPWLIGGLNGHFLPRLPWKYFRNPLKPSRLTQRWSQDHWLLWLSPKILNRLGRGVPNTLSEFKPFLCGLTKYTFLTNVDLMRHMYYLGGHTLSTTAT